MGGCLNRTSASPLETDDAAGVAEYLMMLPQERNIVVLMGAGCSTSAGIPDFRTPGTGLYDNLSKYNLSSPQDIFTLSYFRKHPEPFYLLAREIWPDGRYKPTLAHLFVRLLDLQGRLLRCFTQNIDGLERMAGVPAERVVPAHGTFNTSTCIATGQKVPSEELRVAVMQGQSGCKALAAKYGGLVKPDIVFFGEELPQEFWKCRYSDLPRCKLLFVMGTSLAVRPFASLPNEVPHDCVRVLINREPAGYAIEGTGSRDVSLLGDCDAMVYQLAEEMGCASNLGTA